MKPLYISFFTERYRESAGELRKTLEAFELEHDIQEWKDAGTNWTANVQRKPQFILNMMERHPGRPLVWVDADARIRRRPLLFDEWVSNLDLAPDFAAHWLGGTELLSGTLWFGTRTAAWGLATLWRDEQEVRRDLVDQIVLQNLIESGAVGDVRVRRLPAAMTAIFDHPMTEPHERVIEHMQHSRKYRFVG